jgi:hypothetical protein
MVTCDKCGAVCRDKKDEKRFQRRHPKTCVRHEKFHKALASGTRSVDGDECKWCSAGYQQAEFMPDGKWWHRNSRGSALGICIAPPAPEDAEL